MVAASKIPINALRTDFTPHSRTATAALMRRLVPERG
jgi:hypothetical protein